MVRGNFRVGSSFEFNLACGSPDFSGFDLKRSFALNVGRRGRVDTEADSGTTVGS